MPGLTTTTLSAPIPARARVFGWLLALTGCFFAYVYMASPGAFFPGVAVESFSEKFGLYSTGVRILGSVAGIVVALVLNSAALLALMLLARIFIELGDVAVGLTLNRGGRHEHGHAEPSGRDRALHADVSGRANSTPRKVGRAAALLPPAP